MERFESECKTIESDELTQEALILRPESTLKSTSQQEM